MDLSALDRNALVKLSRDLAVLIGGDPEHRRIWIEALELDEELIGKDKVKEPWSPSYTYLQRVQGRARELMTQFGLSQGTMHKIARFELGKNVSLAQIARMSVQELCNQVPYLGPRRAQEVLTQLASLRVDNGMRI